MKLRNQDIWLGYIKLIELAEIDWPVETSAKIATLINTLRDPCRKIEEERLTLVRKYAEGRKTQQWKAASLAVDFGRILMQYEEEIQIEKVKLPRMKSTVCAKCGEPTETYFLISPDTLAPLLGCFVEIDE